MNSEVHMPKSLYVLLCIVSCISLISFILVIFLWTKPFSSQPEALGEVNVVSSRFPNTASSSTIPLSNMELLTATASLTARVAALEASVAALQVPKSVSTKTSTPAKTLKESYIPLGTGQSAATEWTDIPGVEAYVVPANLGTLTSVYFEVSIRVPTGNGAAYARLLNVTDNVGLFESELSYSGTTGKLLSSGPLPVPTHTTLYRLQLKSSIGATVVADQSRLKLYTK